MKSKNKIKLLYVHNCILPSPSANTIQVTNMCKAFNELNIDVTLLSSGKRISDVQKFYNIDKRIKIILTRQKSNYFKRSFSLIKRFRKINKEFKYIYTRDLLFATVIKLLYPKKKVIYELHDFSNGWLWHKLFKLSFFILDKIVVISNGLVEDMKKQGFNMNKVKLLHDGVDINRFRKTQSKQKARKILKLPLNKKLIIYIGNTDNTHDLDTMLLATKNIKGVVPVIYGVKRDYLKRYKNGLIEGFIKKPEIAYQAADILFAGYTNKVKHIKYMSPLKLFEYMATNKPIVVADFPRTREVLGKDCAVYYKSQDAKDLTKKITQLLKDRKMQKDLTHTAYKKVKNYTWVSRAKKIIELFELK